MAKDEKYFNAPIQLYRNFLTDSSKVLSDVACYACYDHATRNMEPFTEAAGFYNIKFGAMRKSEDTGRMLHNTYASMKTPMVGIPLKIYWQFHSEEKTEFEKVCLLAFLAIKSILQKKPYCKIDNKFWLSRMDGKPTSIELPELSPEIFKYANEYQTVKIKNELRNNWGLVTYSRYTRGFYVSFEMELNDLVFEAEKRRLSVKNKQYKEDEKQAIKLALEKLKAGKTK